ncbi:hypothetical protein Ciccas_007103 [Cichlidogyrus casuarinus]|uniref:Serine aminopeptidase S33 domain-containing protein n=1 Tax=Cichlidogyrus casuarinus TaxID=1844966 RepID=A0ABD2Q3U5_9PLAT
MANLGCSSLCKLFCCPPLPSRIAAKLAFLPPESSYKLQKQPSKDGNSNTMALTYSLSSTIAESASNFDPSIVDMFKAKTRRGNSIAIVFMNINPASEVTFLISHGNAVDIGLMLNFLYDLGSKLKVNIMCYDYSGYGESSGRPLESNLYADADCAIKQLHERYQVPFEKMVLYGQSIGSVPTCHLATKYRVAAVVLHSALLSGIRVPFPEVKKTYCCDVFTKHGFCECDSFGFVVVCFYGGQDGAHAALSISSIAKAPKIISPTLVIHGTKDEVISFFHGLTLYNSLPERMRLPPFFITGAGHNNCELYPGYLTRLNILVNDELPRLIEEAAQHNAELEENNLTSSSRCIPFRSLPPCVTSVKMPKTSQNQSPDPEPAEPAQQILLQSTTDN